MCNESINETKYLDISWYLEISGNIILIFPIFYVPILLKWCCRLCFTFLHYYLSSKQLVVTRSFVKWRLRVVSLSVLSGEITLTEFMEGARKDQWIMDLLNLDVNTSGWVIQNYRKLPWCLAARAASSCSTSEAEELFLWFKMIRPAVLNPFEFGAGPLNVAKVLLGRSNRRRGISVIRYKQINC